ncbi:MAG: glucose-6-phosphate isomerase [Actinomycetaceae bacterium]|nr:glucose-6-phosphate isomerase [Actinomycetaceae bacterium]MDY6082910.1 glucose-6-phosphate isomerase [Actinomycetaceae bacterium]
MEPVDATQTPAWAKLKALAQNSQVDLAQAFAADPQRAQRYTFNAGDLLVDLSKELIDDDILAALIELAEQTHVAERREAMFTGEHINVSEDRAVLHTALRLPRGESLTVDGVDVAADVHEVLERIYAFAQSVADGSWTGVTGKPLTTVINIGIGGSDLGPVMVYEALKRYVRPGMEARFISNVDPTDISETLKDVDPETVLFIVASKTFTTVETMTNARACRRWLLEELAHRGIDTSQATKKHFIAVSTNLEKVEEFGIDPQNAFGFWNWVGGRYSVDSAVGTVLAIVFGRQVFEEFLSGFHTIDQHFRTADAQHNVPLLMGLLNVWYSNFLGAQTHAVLPYSQYLHRFPAYLQQLTMESNGKRVRYDSSPVTTTTGEIFWGEPGTNGQHAFYQLIHQGTALIPADFIGFVKPAWDIRDGEARQHDVFMGNFFAQTQALAFGKSADQVRAEGTPEDIVPARVFPGNKPTASIMAPELTPSVLGQLIALYEHIVFTQGAVWGINSFDQWGVELGKQLALDLAPALAGDEAVIAAQDSSTASLIHYYLEHKDRSDHQDSGR